MRLAALAVVVSASVSAAQTPRPFPIPPRPGNAPAPQEKPAQPPPVEATSGAPTEATLGVPLYPTAQFLTSYDAGSGQRFYIFGVLASFTEIVSYYRTVLKDRGDLVFEQPATHMFEVGRFREESMAFPPSVTVKDFTWGGSEGYLNPKPGATPRRFPTIIQIVPAPRPGVSR